MFILDIIVDVVDNLLQLRYGHNLAICHVVSGVGNYIGLLMKLPFLTIRIDGYVLLNKLEESKDHVNPFQIRGNKCAGSSNRTIGDINCLESQLVLVVDSQGMTGERMKCSQNGVTSPKIQLF